MYSKAIKTAGQDSHYSNRRSQTPATIRCLLADPLTAATMGGACPSLLDPAPTLICVVAWWGRPETDPEHPNLRQFDMPEFISSSTKLRSVDVALEENQSGTNGV
jgi:hypothetical protein